MNITKNITILEKDEWNYYNSKTRRRTIKEKLSEKERERGSKINNERRKIRRDMDDILNNNEFNKQWNSKYYIINRT